MVFFISIISINFQKLVEWYPNPTFFSKHHWPITFHVVTRYLHSFYVKYTKNLTKPIAARSQHIHGHDTLFPGAKILHQHLLKSIFLPQTQETFGAAQTKMAVDGADGSSPTHAVTSHSCWYCFRQGVWSGRPVSGLCPNHPIYIK